MFMNVNGVAVAVFSVALLLGVFSAVVASRSMVAGTKTFTIFTVFIVLYVFAYAMELASLDLPTMHFWINIEYIGISIFPTLFLIFIIQFTGRERWLTPRTYILLFFFPALLLLSKLTDSYTHLFYTRTWIDYSTPTPTIGIGHGPLYYLNIYSSIPTFLGIILLLVSRINTPLIYRRQANIIAYSVIPAWLVHTLNLLKVIPIPVLRAYDINAFLMPVWAAGIGYAIFRYHLLDMAPISREVLLEHVYNGIMVIDHHRRLVDANPPAVKILDWTVPPIGEDIYSAVASWPELTTMLHKAAMEESVQEEIIKTAGGETYHYLTTGVTIRNKNRYLVGQLIIIQDMTEVRRLQAELTALSLHDPLTGLHNRRGFDTVAVKFIEMISRMKLHAAVIMIDIDNMKEINDTFGHSEGDRAIMETTAVLRSGVRSSDILARIGGDEFVALIVEPSDSGAEKMMKRLTAKIDELCDRDIHGYCLGISYGTAPFDYRNKLPLNELMQQADAAMYEQKQAKKVGR